MFARSWWLTFAAIAASLAGLAAGGSFAGAAPPSQHGAAAVAPEHLVQIRRLHLTALGRLEINQHVARNKISIGAAHQFGCLPERRVEQHHSVVEQLVERHDSQ